MPVWPAFQGNLGLSRQCSEAKCELDRTGWLGIVMAVPTVQLAEPSPRHFPRGGSWCPLPSQHRELRLSGAVELGVCVPVTLAMSVSSPPFLLEPPAMC